MNQLKTIVIRRDVQSEEKAEAAAERSRLSERGTLVINLVSSPGAGKTTLLQQTAKYWQGKRTMAVLVGDLETDRDAKRLAPWMPVAQLTTGGACHLELPLVRKGLLALGDPQVDFLFIENVGNLVCPASHDLGEHLRVVMLSATDGDDKPGKYPKMFRTSQAMLISKTDLLPYVPFNVENAKEDAKRIQPNLTILTLSAINGDGVEAWCRYLESFREKLVSRPFKSDDCTLERSGIQ